MNPESAERPTVFIALGIGAAAGMIDNAGPDYRVRTPKALRHFKRC
jgi:hypothetical protein